MTADTFLTLQVDLDVRLVRQAFEEIAARRRRHPRTVPEILERLKVPLPATVAAVRERWFEKK